MRKLFALFLALAASVVTLFAEEVKIGDLYYNLGESTAEVVKSDTYSELTTVDIPPTVNYSGENYTVTSIGNEAFAGKSNITSVTMAASVTIIKGAAFCQCYGLTTLTIPSSVKTIEYEAFYGCSSLTSITIPNSVISMHDHVFYGCSNLTSVTIGNSLDKISISTFEGCTSLTSVTIGNSVTKIDNAAFKNCRSLTSITFPVNVKEIGYDAFSGCTGLESITCKPTTPPSCGAHTFDGVNRDIPVNVPRNCKDAYLDAPIWSEFTNITEPTAIEMVKDQSQTENKFIRNGQLYLMYNGTMYNVQGAEVR